MGDTTVRAAAQGLILAAFKTLDDEGLVPRGRRARIQVGIDYAGQTLMALPEFAAFERALQAAYPGTFEAPLGETEFASSYAFPLVEGAAGGLVGLGGDHTSDTPAVATAVDELMELLARDRDQAIAARVLTDVEVDSPIAIGGVEVHPVDSLRSAFDDIDQLIPGVGPKLHAESGMGPVTFTFAMLITRTSAPRSNEMHPGYYAALREATARISNTLDAMRLATATTAATVFEVLSPPGRVRLHRPQIVRYEYAWTPVIQRIGRLSTEVAAPIGSLAERLTRWRGDDRDPHAVGIALDRYTRSFLERHWFDNLADIVIGLEAVLLGGADKDEVSLKLRSRAAALLSTSSDPPARIYQDVKRLYNLRSGIVHGSGLTAKQIETDLHQVSPATSTKYRGVKGRLALDRGRDILRRAILARAFLGEVSKWPPGREGRKVDVDGALIDPGVREEWRQAWRGGLEAIGLGAAADAAPAAAHQVALPHRG